MRTDTDLRDAFAERAAAAPSGDRILEALFERPARTRAAAPRRRGGPVVSAAVLVAGAAAVVLAVAVAPGGGEGPLQSRGTVSPGSTVAPDPRLTVANVAPTTPPAPYTLQQVRTAATHDVVVWSDSTTHVADAVEAIVYRRGAFDAPSPSGGNRRVTLDPRTGIVRTVVLNPVQGRGPTSTPGLMWQYATDAWALVASTERPLPTSTAVALARTVHPGRTSAVRLPVAPRYVPTGLRPVAVTADAAAPYSVEVDYADAGGHSRLHLNASLVPGQSAQALFGSASTFRSGSNQASITSTTVGDARTGTQLTVLAGDIVVMADADLTVTPAELTRVGALLRFPARPQQRSTWFGAAAALRR